MSAAPDVHATFDEAAHWLAIGQVWGRSADKPTLHRVGSVDAPPRAPRYWASCRAGVELVRDFTFMPAVVGTPCRSCIDEAW